MSDQLDNRIDELLALALLGEISPAEEAELDAALAADAELAAEHDADVSVAAALQATLAEDPPASLKTSLMATIDALEVAASPAPPVVGDDHQTPLANPGVVDFAAARAKRRSRWQPLAAAAAVALLFVGGVLVANRGGDDGSRFDAIAAADDAQHRTFDSGLDGSLDVVYSPSHDSFVLVGSGIPTLVDAETYQLWFVDDNGPKSVGLFRPHDDGSVEQVFEDLDPSDFIVGVTIEPASGSEQPTLPILTTA